MSRSDRWMPLYVGDYLADTRRLTLEQHGAYLLLIMDYWKAGFLPENEVKIASILGLKSRYFKSRIWPIIGQFFYLENGCYRHKRIDQEIEKAEGISRKRAGAATKRWDANAHASASVLHTLLHSTTTTTEERKKERKEESKSLVGFSETQAVAETGRSPRGSRLPHDWRPSPPNLAFASDLGLAPDSVLAGFRDYWLAKPGAGGRKSDWDATWRNWCRRDAERRNGTKPPRQTSFRNGFAEIISREGFTPSVECARDPVAAFLEIHGDD